jgi:hypothetical protein
MRVKLLGKFWNLVYGDPGRDADGKCSPPDLPNKTITIRKSLTKERELEILIHEMLHAVDWHKDEEHFIQPAAEDIARVLWKLGYRRNKDAEK